ncbi:hypothetical protein UMM65_00360 [Aureibaculum sp. 2210JD6-5]|uniref:hypothetical protein n=1 Tax=Aureibaculum sp. 2210JD6-5 TaxID=3103957 RepID=UPI002AAC4F78|nr:hypothetical protein [Aureibaculum sp. 2210JD6-5]MDY7393681.1 hypothetical protein [Aureibaculum sp. 2210JD6-5]
MRKLALVNGSLLGSKAFKNPFKINHFNFNDNNALRDDHYSNSEEQVLDIVGIKNILGAKIVGTRLHAYFMPESGNHSEVAHFYRKQNPYYSVTRSRTNYNSRGSMDNVPGGWFPTQQILTKTTIENKPSELSWFEMRKIEHVNSFIPVASALGFKNPDFNWGQKMDRNLICNDEIPFDSYYGPKINERHTSFTEESVNWLLAELAGKSQPPTVYLKDKDITGVNCLCSNEVKTYSIDACKVSGTINWQVSSNLQIISSTNNSVNVKPINSQISGMAYVQAVLSTGTIKKEVWAGKPKTLTYYILNVCRLPYHIH